MAAAPYQTAIDSDRPALQIFILATFTILNFVTVCSRDLLTSVSSTAVVNHRKMSDDSTDTRRHGH